MLYLQLFLSFFQIGLFSIGGGYAAMPLIENQVVEIHPWLTMAQFSDIITISQMTPGPIAINSATFVGIQIAGIPGAVIATLGCIIPSCVIVMLLAFLYYRYRNLTLMQGVLGGLRPAVIAMIASSGVSLLLSALWADGIARSISTMDWIAVCIFIVSLIILRKWKVNPILVMVCAGIGGGICYHFMAYGVFV